MCPDRYSPADTLITDFCDSDAKWGPLLFLRPARSQRWSGWRCLALATFPGLALGLLGSVLVGALAHSLNRPSLPVYVFPSLLTGFYFLVCRMLLAPSWNRRAALLTNGRA
jgi:hypothetical protein